MKAETFKEMLHIIEEWQKGAEEERYLCRVNIYCGLNKFTCKPWDLLDYCTGSGEWEDGDSVGYNTGEEICLIDLDSITAIKVKAYDKSKDE